MDIPSYTPIYVPARPEYTWTSQREWDQLAKYTVCTTGNVVEIGCNKGKTTKLFGLNFPNRIVYAVDFYSSDPTMSNEQIQQQQRPLYKGGGLVLSTTNSIAEQARDIPNVIVINTNSHTYDYNNFKDATFFFIDADHSYNGVKTDVENAIRYLKTHSGGYIACHDYGNERKHPWIKVKEYIDSEIRPHYKVEHARKTTVAIFKVDRL